MADDTWDLMKKGINYLALGEFKDALSYFEEILKIDTDNLAALNNKCLSLNGLSRFNEAIVGFDKILEMDCTFYFSLLGKGESLYYLGYYESALDYFNRVLELDPNNDYAEYFKARSFYKLNQYSLAVKSLDRVKDLSKEQWLDVRTYNKALKKSAESKFNKRQAFAGQINNLIFDRDYSELLNVLDDALEFDNKSTVFKYAKANCLYNLGRYHDALTYLNEILKIDFINIKALTLKSDIYRELNKYDDALLCLNNVKKYGGDVDEKKYAKLVSKVNRGELDHFIKKGNDYLMDDDYKHALECYNYVLNMDSENIIALNNKGFILYLLSKYDEAIEIFNRVLSIKKNHVSSLLGKSYSLYYLSRYNDALECYNLIIAQNKEFCDVDYLNLLIESTKLYHDGEK